MKWDCSAFLLSWVVAVGRGSVLRFVSPLSQSVGAAHARVAWLGNLPLGKCHRV